MASIVAQISLLLLLVSGTALAGSGRLPPTKRFRRQLDTASGASHLDLNITVPYIFSARLYTYGVDRGDKQIPAGSPSQHLQLQTPLVFLGRQYASLYVSRICIAIAGLE